MVAYRLATVYMLWMHCYVHHYSLSSPLTGPVSVCSEEEENQENHAKPHPTYKIMKWCVCVCVCEQVCMHVVYTS